MKTEQKIFADLCWFETNGKYPNLTTGELKAMAKELYKIQHLVEDYEDYNHLCTLILENT